MLRRLTFLSIVFATISLVSGFLLSGNAAGVFLSLLVGLAWVVLELLNRHWAASPGLALMVIFAAVGAFQEYFSVLDALAVVAALCAWDLARFRQRLKLVEDAPTWSQAIRSHVRRLLMVNAAGLGFAALAIAVQLRGAFGVAWFLAVGAIIALFILVLQLAKMTR
jgi:hypothetical protein